MNDLTATVDVTVPNPLAPTHRKLAARGTQAVAKEAEQKKANKFDEISKRNDATFYAFGVEAFGAFGPSAVKFMHLLADFAINQANPPTREAFLAQAVGAVSVAVQRRLGRILTQAIQNARARSVGHAWA